MQICPTVPKCAPRKKDKCIKPNPWLIFLMAYSDKALENIPQNNPFGDRSYSLSEKAEVYKNRVENNLPLCVDKNKKPVLASVNSTLCKMYRDLHHLKIHTTIANDHVVHLKEFKFPKGSSETLAWALKAVGTTKPKYFNRTYGYYYKPNKRDSVGGVFIAKKRISFDTILRLSKTCWLNDEIINGFLSLLWGKCNKTRTLIWSSLSFGAGDNSINQYTSKKRKELLNQVKICCGLEGDEIQLSVIPYNISLVHWILMVYDHVRKSWHSYDSFNANHEEIAKSYHTSFMNMIGETNVFAYSPKIMPQQKDMYQCGVWTCIAGLCAVMREKLPEHAFNQAKEYSESTRCYIAQTMQSNDIRLVEDNTVDLDRVPWKPEDAISRGVVKEDKDGRICIDC